MAEFLHLTKNLLNDIEVENEIKTSKCNKKYKITRSLQLALFFSCTDLTKVFHAGLSYKYQSLAYFADNGGSVITLDINSI